MSRADVKVVMDEAAIRDYMVGRDVRDEMQAVGDKVRDKARVNASGITAKTDAIISTTPAEDADGVYVDVGYAKHSPGFFLWWWEVGTRNHAARPHLRPALREIG